MFYEAARRKTILQVCQKLLGRDRMTEEDKRRGIRSEGDQRSMQVRRGCVGNSSTSNHMRRQPYKFSRKLECDTIDCRNGRMCRSLHGSE
jgi:hypothetical protein